MARQCFHCKEWIEEGQPHDCWTTTEAALTQELSLDLREAWERLRETAADFGEQRIYASHHSIMFARKSCYFFVRPKRSYLEVCIFLGRPINAPQIRQVVQSSKSKVAHLLRIRHRDEVEPPITEWLREAYDYNLAPVRTHAPATPPQPARAARKHATKKKRVAANKTTAAPRGTGKAATRPTRRKTKKSTPLTRTRR